MANVPENLHYSKDHEWVRVEGDIAVVGITDHAQEQLGDVVYVELPKSGEEFIAHESFGSVESVKAVSEIYAPVSGDVVEANGDLQNAPEKINTDPHGSGWLVKVRLTNAAELNGLMDAPAYEAYIAAKSTEASA